MVKFYYVSSCVCEIDSIMQTDINLDLVEAISEHDVVSVRRCLQGGANPNFTWDHDMDSNADSSMLQPTTPLSLVMFRISDCLLDVGELFQYYEIAKMLLENDADPEPALHLAMQRYGIYKKSENPSGFDDIYRLVYEAYQRIRGSKD